MKVALICTGVLAVTLLAVWLAGIRIFVVQPLEALPEGVTAILMGVPNLRFVDSPDAFCSREVGSVTLLCRGMVTGKVAKDATILLKLPFSETLYGLSGAPETVR